MAHAGKEVRLCRVCLLRCNQGGRQLLLLTLFLTHHISHIRTGDADSFQFLADIENLKPLNAQLPFFILHFHKEGVGILFLQLPFHIGEIQLVQIFRFRRFVHIGIGKPVQLLLKTSFRRKYVPPAAVYGNRPVGSLQDVHFGYAVIIQLRNSFQQLLLKLLLRNIYGIEKQEHIPALRIPEGAQLRTFPEAASGVASAEEFKVIIRFSVGIIGQHLLPFQSASNPFPHFRIHG